MMEFIVKDFEELTTTELYEILKSRAEIFILEQNIICLDMDNVDYKSFHCFIREDDRVVAYLRAYYKDGDADTVHIGRVLTLQHGRGFGKILLEKSMDALKKKTECKRICMDAQKHAIGFYEKFGFQVTSDEFLEEGIVHVTMELEL